MSKNFTAGQIIQAIRKAKGLKAGAAQILKCDRKTLYVYIKKLELREVLDEEKENFGDMVESKIRKAILQDEDREMMRFYARTQLANRGYSERFQIENKYPEKIRIEVVK